MEVFPANKTGSCKSRLLITLGNEDDVKSSGENTSLFQEKRTNINKVDISTNRKPTIYGKLRQSQRKKCIQFLLLKLFLICINFQLNQAALLTNIYGKKLSELRGDLSHRFLLLPSPFAKNKPISLQTTKLSENNSARNDNHYTQTPTSPMDFVQQGNKYEYANVDRNTSIEPLSSPLALAWKQQQQQQQTGGNPNQQQRSLRLLMQNSTTFSESPQQNRMASGEPQFAEGVSTEFPNPNINNLGHEITKILRKFFLHGYDKRVRPNYSGPAALVNVSFHIIGISSVDEVQMDFTTDFYFRQKWSDPRLVFDPVGEIDELCVGAEFAEKIWLPDTFFANEKTATFHRATTENTFIRIGHNGRVYRSIRLTVTCSCPMDLQYFPMDRQRCKIEIESYGYNARDIEYHWERGDASVSLNTKIELPQFKILGFRMGQEVQNLSSGDYIRLYCEIHFVRSMGYYLFQIYIPASLIVMISWVSFWLHRNATPARVALGVTTVLTMTTLMSSTNAALPKISYIKSIDVFLGTCFVMVFAALLEYASVGYIGKRIAMKRKRMQELQQMQQHHQKVCVAAAASAAASSAAAAAAAAHEGRNFSPGATSEANLAPWASLSRAGSLVSNGSQTLGRLATSTIGSKLVGNRSKTIQRAKTISTGRAPPDADSRGSSIRTVLGGEQNGAAREQRSSSRAANVNQNTTGNKSSAHSSQPQTPLKRTNVSRFMNPFAASNQHQANQQAPNNQVINSSRTPFQEAGLAIAAVAANHHSHGPTTEFEVNQTHDLIRICGLTPSSIDKHSRVVFPICFVCFNLMYWIIYGHISQQIEDKGVPLIPFIKG